MSRLRSLLTLRTSLIALAALLLIGGGIFAAPLLLRGPQLVRVSLADGEPQANPQADLRIEFDQPVQPDSLGAIQLDPPAEFTVRSEGGVVTLSPRDGLDYGVQYTLTIGAVRNILGRTLAQPQTISFTTAPYISVGGVGPTDGAQAIGANEPLIVEFSAPVVSAAQVAAAADDPRQATGLPQPIALSPPAPGAGQWLSPTRYSFSPADGWSAATTYSATVQAQISTDGQARMAQPFAWRFTTAATVLAATRPFDQQADVPADSPVEVRLARDVDVASAAKSFTLTDADGKAVPGSLQLIQAAFVFTPDAPLARGARYAASLAPGVQAASGASINSEALSWSFGVIDNLAVAQVIPAADASEVLTLTRQIAVSFNHPVVAVTAPADQASLPQPLSISPAVQGVGRWLDTSTFVFSPTAALLPATSYRVEVASGLRDQTGGALGQPFSWSFSTITPQALGSLPADGEPFASPRDPLIIVFNQPMDLASLRGAISLQSASGAEVPSTIALARPPAFNPTGPALPAGFAVSFSPATALERGERYSLAVSSAARTANGSVALSQAYRASFSVAPLPQLLSSTPNDGSQAVEPGSSIELTFSAPMDWASVDGQLTIDPQPTSIYTYTDQNKLSLSFDLIPETDYQISIGAAAKDPYGVVLGQPASLSFRSAALQPALNLASQGRVGAYSSYDPARIPIQTVNVTSISYDLYRLDPEELPARLADAQDDQRWRGFTPSASSRISGGDLSPQGARNQTALTLVDLGALPAGAYLAEVRGAGVTERQLLIVSPYTLTIKRSAEQLFVWAVDLASGEPVADLPLQAAYYSYDSGSLSAPRELGRTDTNGVVQAAFSAAGPYDQLFVWSGAGAPFTLSTTAWSDGIDPYSFSLPATGERTPIVGSLSTDRPLYRPGELVHMRGVLRLDNDGRYRLPQADQRADLAISDPEGNTIYSRTLTLNDFGSFSADLPLQGAASLGQYFMSAQLSGEPAHSFYGSFSVAEYRKPVFEIGVTPARPDLLRGEPIEASVTAKYFAGGVLADAPVRWRLLSAPLYFSADQAAGYQFEDLDDAYASYRWFDGPPDSGGELLAEGSGATDAQGNFRLSLPGALAAEGGSRQLTLDVEVSDIDGQVIAGQGGLRLHAGAFYIGLRPDGYVAQAGKPQQVALITLDPQGQPVAGRALDVAIYSREWYSVREQGPDGRFYFTSAFSDTLIQTIPATSDGQGRATVSFSPPKGGSYRIAATGKDDGGRTVKASAFTWAVGGAVFWGVNDTNRIDLIADQASYKPGDTAQILVTAPYKGSTALLTIERGAVIEHRLLRISGTSELIALPISADYAPNIYVSLVLITPAAPGGVGSLEAPATPDLRVGLINLAVSTEQQDLTISISADKAEVGPRDEVTYSITTSDYTGKGVPAEVSLALVDKAVLSLADDPNPSLRQAFYEKRPLGVFTSQSITVLASRVALALADEAKGGGGGLSVQGMVRRDFPDTAYWNAGLVTGADGTASLTVALPDSLTTWRMSARGVTKDTLVGQATSEIVATRPLLVRPSLPRFLTEGDKPTLQAVVQNSTASPIEASVSFEIITPEGQQPVLRLDDPAQQTVSVPANGQVLLRWRAEAVAGGQASIRLSVAGGGLEDALEKNLPIQRYATPETVASAGQVFDTTIETIRPPADARGELSLELVPSLGAGVQSGLRYLESFPYGCSEQTVSAFLPNAVTYRLYKQLGIEDAELKASLEQNLASGLQRLYALQNLDGGWGWWANDASQPYLSAYVVQGLSEALKAGYSVDQSVLDRSIAYLNAALEQPADKASLQPLGSQLSARGYILFVLGELGQPDRGRTVALYDQRAQLAIDGRAYLLMTLSGLGDAERAAVLVGELTSSAIMRPTDAHWEEAQADYWTMGSTTRTTALAMQALLRAEPGNVLIPNAVRYLMSLRDEGHWRTTQETALALIGLSEYVAQSGELQADYSYRAALNDKTLDEGQVNANNLSSPISLVVSLADLAQGVDSQLSIQRQAASGQSGKGRLYYTLRLRTFADASAAQALDQGVGVQREYATVDTATLSPTGQLTSQAQLGEIVQVRLTLNVPEDMPYFMVEDMLPAGLEPLDTSLKTTSAAADSPDLAETGRRPSWWYFGRTEIRDNRVALFATNLPRGSYSYTYLARATTPGTFQTLPATAMRTYAPEVFGRSAGALFTVIAP